MNKTQAGRLLTLAYFLRTQVPKENFDMTSVLTLSREGIPPEEQLQEGFCGTTACAIGWCPIVFEDWEYTWHDGAGTTVTGPRHNWWEYEAETYFGLTNYEVAWLFDGSHQRSPKQEAAELEKMAANYGYEYADC